MSDNDIINQVLKGNTDAFSQLIKRYQAMVFTLSLRLMKQREEAEELAQDVFVQAFRKLYQFKQEAKFSSWLYSITYRLGLNKIKKNQRNLDTDDLDLHHHDMSTSENVEKVLSLNERNIHIKECIGQLGEEEAYLVTLFYYEELSIKEIASITQLTETNIKTKLFRARKKLYYLLEKENIYESRG